MEMDLITVQYPYALFELVGKSFFGRLFSEYPRRSETRRTGK
jgi:hypothetical protein